LVDGVIFLNQASMAIASAEHKALIGNRSAVIPPMTYNETFSARSQPRKCIENTPVRLGYFGLIRPYKQVDRLMRCMREVPETEAFLAVSGMIVLDPREQEYKELAQNSGNIRFSNEFLADEQLERFVDDCDAIVLPYREILNSGSAIFALSRLRPVMVPDLGSMAELKETAGGNWVFCYSGELTASKIRDFVAWVRTTERTSPPDMSTFDSELVAAMTARFYFSLASGSSH
jgi:glycosyltransferase involved in cell wall biosynthesis